MRVIVGQVLVARMTQSIVDRSIPLLTIARSAAVTDIDRLDSSPLIHRRERIPLRSKIHSSVESSVLQSSSLVITRWGGRHPRRASRRSAALSWLRSVPRLPPGCCPRRCGCHRYMILGPVVGIADSR